METLNKARELARKVAAHGSVTPDYGAQADLQVELTQEVSAKLYHLAGVIARSSQKATEDLESLGRSLGAVVSSMDKSTDTIAHLTRWLIVAALVSAVAATVQVLLLFLKGG
ncbi:MAG: hypothetical protein HYY65_03150 [Candidatus Tectomicrobia bacterium]|uniref:Uncharacterized protein n=1 Tax=Tectimicrobiota bacterium TaxID=2528274 RepID=A0A932GMV4_UNCTE|nr:hypothetical protein [Candidatus Tectomicrobia bacterium]